MADVADAPVTDTSTATNCPATAPATTASLLIAANSTSSVSTRQDEVSAHVQPSHTRPVKTPCSRKRRAATSRLAAVEGVSEAAKYQKEYYAAKLDMARELHAAKMRALQLKERLLENQLKEE